MAAKRKCYICGEELHSISKRSLEYSVVLQNAKGSYHLCGRMKWNDKWSMLLSEQEDNPRIYSRPHPLCPACFLKKLRRAVVALETALEGKGIDPDDMPEAEQEPEDKPKKPEEQQPKAPEITAEDVRRDYPEWCAKLKAAANGREVDDGTLLEIFLKHRKHGMV